MPDDDDAIEVPFDPPDPDSVYRNCLQTCRRSGVKPVPRDRAQDLIAEWSAVSAARKPPLH